MKEYPLIEGLSKEQCGTIFGQIAQLARETFRSLDLSSNLIEAAQKLLLEDFASKDLTAITDEFVANSLFPRAVNSVFDGFHESCRRFCLSRTQDTHLADDTAQEAIKLLLLSPKRVVHVGAWLFGTVRKLLLKHAEYSERYLETPVDSFLDAILYKKWLLADELNGLKEIDPDMLEEIMETDEYKRWYEIASYGSIKDYAAAHNISEQTARKRKDMAFRDMRSMILRRLGWRGTPKILNYHQYDAVLRFISDVKRMCGGDESVKWMKSLSPEHREAVKKIRKVFEWGINAIGDYSFRLHFFTILEDGKPYMVSFIIALNKRNSVSLQSCSINLMANTRTIPGQARIPKDKGVALLTYDQILALLG